MEPRDKYEHQPFISYSASGDSVSKRPSVVAHHHSSRETNRRLQRHNHGRRRSKCGLICCLFLILLVLLILPIVLVFYVWVWPSECFHLLDENAPIQLGLNVQNSRLFIIFTKPLPTGAFNSSLNVCGQSTNFDTTFFPAFGGLNLASANFTLKTQRCQKLPLGVDANRGTLKFIIDGNNNETTVTVQNVHVAFHAMDLPEHGYFELTSGEDGGVKAKTPASEISIDFLGDGVAKFEPAIGVVYSKFTAVVTSEVTLLSGNSPNNHCGGPAIGVTLDGNVFMKAWQAFRHWINYSFPELSPIGIVQLFQLLSLQISQVQLNTKPVIFETTKSIEPKHVPVFLKQGYLQVDRSSITLSNLSLQISSSKKDDVHLRTLARIEVHLPAGNVDAVASLKKRLHLTTSFRDSLFELPFDIDISNSNSRRNETEDISKVMASGSREMAAGQFRMRNITLRTAENSSIFTPSLSGVVEPIYVRSSRQIVSTPQCSAMLLKFVSMDFITSAMTVPEGESLKVVVVGTAHDTTPLTINLYQLGRVANNIKMIVSTTCLDENKQPSLENKSQEKRHSLNGVGPRSEALLTAGTYHYNFTFGDETESSSAEKSSNRKLNEDTGMKLQYWSFDADGVDARVYPIENFLQIDKIAVKLNTTNEKANLDLQVGLKQSSSHLVKALL